MTVRYGMVGGGPGAFIGAVHRMAARLDGLLELVAGAFSSDPERSASMGRELGLAPARAYGSWQAMVEGEAALPPAQRMQLVAIVTPNHLHHAVASACLAAGFDVVCDKPLTTTLADAEELCRLAAAEQRLFAVTYNYTGYPMVKEARARVRGGALGEVRKVMVEYTQGWLRTLLEAEGQKQAEWRADPERAGRSAALSDIGTHAHNLLEYVTGLEVGSLLAELSTLVPGRRLEDDATVLLRFRGGARGVLGVSQVATGERNHLRLRVYGSEGGLDWCQERPDRLRLTEPRGTETLVFDGAEGLSAEAAAHVRLPGGHPEGFIEAFANIYRNVAAAVTARAADGPGSLVARDFPTVRDGARGVHFVHAALRSAREGGWVDARYAPP
jgi:predicted dehydrogenase